MTLRRVLFVDDEPNILAGLRRSLRTQRSVWEMLFAGGGEEALALMADEPMDVVISDMRMPGMDGGQLLAEVRRRHPQTARIILSGHADRASVVSAVGPTQQYLVKPCDVEVLVTTVERVLAIRDLVTDQRLREILGSVETLPKPPAIYEEMLALTENPDCSIADIVAVVEKDVSTTAEVVRLVNSAFFGLPCKVPNVGRAVKLLGIETIQALALAGAVFRSGTPLPTDLALKEVSDRGLAVATLAKRFAEDQKWPSQTVADLFMAGLMHEVGLLVLAAALPQAWCRLRTDGVAKGLDEQDALEREAFGCSVSEASAYLLGLWGFHETVVATIAAQPAPVDDVSAAPAAQVLSAARRLDRYGPTDLHPVNGSFVDDDRCHRWVQLSEWAELSEKD